MMPALFARKANDADASKSLIHNVRRSLINLSRVGSFRAGRHGDPMRKLLTVWIVLGQSSVPAGSASNDELVLSGSGNGADNDHVESGRQRSEHNAIGWQSYGHEHSAQIVD